MRRVNLHSAELEHDDDPPGYRAGRVLMLSTMRQPKVIAYPDSDKVGVRTADGTDKGNFRRASGLDYWDGEPVAEG